MVQLTHDFPRKFLFQMAYQQLELFVYNWPISLLLQTYEKMIRRLQPLLSLSDKWIPTRRLLLVSGPSSTIERYTLLIFQIRMIPHWLRLSWMVISHAYLEF